jgi:murein DD-endopeptidase
MTSREGPAGVTPLLPSIAILALFLLPVAACSSTPVQADPDTSTNAAPARAVQDADTNVVPAQPGDDVDVNVAATGQDAEDSAVLVVAHRDADVAVAPQRKTPDVGAYAVRHALKMVGTPYVWGGSAPGGFDCSGLVQYSYALAGVAMPRAMIQQRAASRAVPRKQIRPGDLVFFHIDGKRNSHIGIYIGDGKFVHAPSTGKLVSTASLSNPYWQRHFGGARRPLALADNRRIDRVSVDRVSVDRVPVDRVSVLDRLRTEQ